MTIAPPIAIADTTAPVRKKPMAARMPAPSIRNQIRGAFSRTFGAAQYSSTDCPNTRSGIAGLDDQERCGHNCGGDAREPVGNDLLDHVALAQNRCDAEVRENEKTAATVVTPIPRIR